jgi:hypothetical protein
MIVSPVIDPEYLFNSADLDMFIGMMKYARRLANTEPLRSTVIETITPSPDLKTDEELAEYVKKAWTQFVIPSAQRRCCHERTMELLTLGLLSMERRT